MSTFTPRACPRAGSLGVGGRRHPRLPRAAGKCSYRREHRQHLVVAPAAFARPLASPFGHHFEVHEEGEIVAWICTVTRLTPSSPFVSDSAVPSTSTLGKFPSAVRSAKVLVAVRYQLDLPQSKRPARWRASRSWSLSVLPPGRSDRAAGNKFVSGRRVAAGRKTRWQRHQRLHPWLSRSEIFPARRPGCRLGANLHPARGGQSR